MVKKRSRSKERRKKSRQKNRWTEAKKIDKREKENARKREKKLSKQRNNDSGMQVKTKKRKMTDLINGRKSTDISEYEQFRNRNIKERLDAMLKSKLWSEKEIEDLKKSYFPNDYF